MSKDLVEILTVTYEHELLIYTTKLESERIKCYTTDQLTVAVDPMISNAIGGIKLKVEQKDVLRALQIIKHIHEERIENSPEFEIVHKGKEYQKVYKYCPSCESANAYVEKINFLQELLKSFSKKNYYCLDCKHEWKNN